MKCNESCEPKKLWMKECSQTKADAIERNDMMQHNVSLFTKQLF